MFRSDLLKGKRILVTGGGTGLGRVMAEKYLELGASVYICGRRKAMLDEAAAEMTAKHGGFVKGIPVDIRVAQAVDDMIAEIWADGPLDGLVNNAAGNFISPTADISPRGFDAIANIVLHGTFYVTTSVGKRWIAEKHKGTIISILVTWVWTGSPFVVPSAMSKSGVAAMTKSLAVEWGPYGIRLNAIAPGPFPTKGAWERLSPGSSVSADGALDNDALTDRASSGISPMGRVGQMPELANLATFLMADGCDYLTGEVIAIDGAQWLTGGGTFSRLSQLTEAEWDQIRLMIRGANERDKAARTV